jgi:dihydrolipoamide dehydrogenase
MSEYDVTIIGAGPGGYVAAIRAAQLGLNVALVEQEHLGGVCLNWGCIPTKALLRNAEVISLLDRGREFGFSVSDVQVDFGAAVDRSRKVSERLVKGVDFLMRKNDIDVIEGRGILKSPTTVDVELGEGTRTIETSNVVIATGGRARKIPGIETDGERVMTYRSAIVLRVLPKSVIIVGAGPIGIEFAHIWSSYGTEVTVVEMLPHAVPLEDAAVSIEVERAFKRRRVNIMTSTRVQDIENITNGVRVAVAAEDGKHELLEAERILIAIGVRPNSENIGLEDVGVETEQGNIVVDDHMRTNVPGVYAIGDVTGKMALAHVASAQGIIAVETLAGEKTRPLDYDAIPRCTYCQPQVASFGITEAEAKDRGHDVAVGEFPFRPNGKALALGEREGFVKIVADTTTGEILGASLIGPEVTELLPELVLARTWELTPEEIARTVHAHPTLSEALMEASHGVFGDPIHS